MVEREVRGSGIDMARVRDCTAARLKVLGTCIADIVFRRGQAKGISLYRSVIAVAQDPDGDHSIHDSLHANPQRLRARFAVALAPEESAQRRDHPYHLVERRWFFRTRLLTEHVSAVYLVSREKQRCVQLRTGSSDTYEPRDPPRYDHVQRERLLHPLHL